MNDTGFRRVNPTRPPAAYIGGKKMLAARLVERIAAVPHSSYAEPFVGMGGVFLRRTSVPSVEIINDISGDVANLFRVLQRHYVAFMDMLRFQLTGRREFERLLAQDPKTLTDLERAARFLYVQRLAYGGKVAGRNFGVSTGLPGRFDVTKLGPLLADLSERLAGVIIENLPYGEFLARYDVKGALFYCDPPYSGSEDDYGAGVFGPLDFDKLAAILGGLKGVFLLSINATPEMRKVFARFDVEEVDVGYSIAGGEWKISRELIVSTVGLPRETRAPTFL
jgi:DNA adenine methylase